MRHSSIAGAAALTILAAWPLLAAPGHDHAGHGDVQAAQTVYGQAGDDSRPARTIAIVMRESDDRMLFIPDRIEVRQGEQIQFALRNSGELDHELVIGTASTNAEHAAAMTLHPGMNHDDSNSRQLQPKQTGSLRWQFTQSGDFEYVCLIPGHKEAGMRGRIVVR